MKRFVMLLVGEILWVPVMGWATIPTLHSPLDGDYLSRHVNMAYGATWCFEKCPPDPGGVCKIHNGRDVAASVGENVYAVDAGTVKAVVFSTTWRYCVTIQHNGFTSVVWHLEPTVGVNDVVARGQKIGTVADLGSNTHSHLGIRNGTYSNTSNRGALPTATCGGDPAFPENFVNPGMLSFTNLTYTCQLMTQNTSDLSFKPGDPVSLWVEYRNTGTATWLNSGGWQDPERVELWACEGDGGIEDNNGNPVSSWFVPGDWIGCPSPCSHRRVTVADQTSVGPGGTARFTFTATIPNVPSQDIRVWFRLVHGGIKMDPWGGLNWYVHVDADPPTPFSASVEDPSTSNVNTFSFSWTASSDARSGLKRYLWSVNGGSETPVDPPTATFLPARSYATQQGDNTFVVVAEDNVGNRRAAPPVTFTLTSSPCPGREIAHSPNCRQPNDPCLPAMASNLQTLPPMSMAQLQSVGAPIRDTLKPGTPYSLGFEYKTATLSDVTFGLGTFGPATRDLGVVIGKSALPAGDQEWRPFWSAPFSVTADQLQQFGFLRLVPSPAIPAGLDLRNVRIVAYQ